MKSQIEKRTMKKKGSLKSPIYQRVRAGVRRKDPAGGT